MPRRPDPAIATRLVEVTARVLAEEGEGAVSARRVAAEAGVSTMAVYTHHGGMDELLAAVRAEGFRRFGAELRRPAHTADVVADLLCQGWAYRHFARTEPHLYRVMFSSRVGDPSVAGPADAEASMATFLSLHEQIGRCAGAGRWRVPDLLAAAEVVWAFVHGQCTIELTGHRSGLFEDPVRTFEEGFLRLAVGWGDDPAAVARSQAAARRRARRAGQLDGAAGERAG